MEEANQEAIKDVTISPDLVMMNIEAGTDFEVLDIMANHLKDLGYVKDTYIQAVKDREKNFCTGLQFPEMGIALPHTDSVHVNKQAICIGILKNPITFHAMGSPEETVPVQLIFMLAIQKPDAQLSFLGNMMTIFQEEGALLSIRQAKTAQEAADKFAGFFRNISEE